MVDTPIEHDHMSHRPVFHNPEADLERLLAKEIGRDYTIIGHNYMGPNTPIVHNLVNGVMPTDSADWASFKHDFEYVDALSRSDITTSDRNFGVNQNNENFISTFDTETTLARMALILKDTVGLSDYFWTKTDMTPRERQALSILYNKINNKRYDP